MQRRRNRRFRFWCLPRPPQSWFEIHYNDHRIPDGFFKLIAVASCEHVVPELRNPVSAGISHLIGVGTEKNPGGGLPYETDGDARRLA